MPENTYEIISLLGEIEFVDAPNRRAAEELSSFAPDEILSTRLYTRGEVRPIPDHLFIDVEQDDCGAEVWE